MWRRRSRNRRDDPTTAAQLRAGQIASLLVGLRSPAEGSRRSPSPFRGAAPRQLPPQAEPDRSARTAPAWLRKRLWLGGVPSRWRDLSDRPEHVEVNRPARASTRRLQHRPPNRLAALSPTAGRRRSRFVFGADRWPPCAGLGDARPPQLQGHSDLSMGTLREGRGDAEARAPESPAARLWARLRRGRRGTDQATRIAPRSSTLGIARLRRQTCRSLLSTSGCPDLNRGPPPPKGGALPGCATPRAAQFRVAADG